MNIYGANSYLTHRMKLGMRNGIIKLIQLTQIKKK
nr:MAG TPA: hypothetical protein [Caudoviricetes sp.]